LTKAFGLFVVATVAVLVGVGFLLTLGFTGPGDAPAIRLSAIVVAVVQLATFTVARLLAPKNVIAGWGAGALLRVATLVVYALLIVKVLAMPVTAALVSMAVFFFLTTLFEPLLLKI